MHVSAFVHIHRAMVSRTFTGVSKHISQMVTGLAQRPEIELSLLTDKEFLLPDQTLPLDTPLRGLPFRTFNWRRRWLEASWSILNWPGAERWTGPVDWIYCPADTYVAHKTARLAVTVHCVNWFDPELPWYNDALIQKTRRAMQPRFRRFRTDTDLVFPVSEFLAGRLTVLFGIPPERMRVVGNGVESDYFRPGELPVSLKNEIGEHPYVVVVGGLTQRKGAECVIEVAEELAKRNSPVNIHVAGNGETKYDEAFRRCSHLKNIGYVGVDNGLPALLAHSTALLFPSRYETFGIPAVEAMAAGTPAIVSHWAALPEVVGEAGIVVDPEQPEAIADIINNLHRDRGLREKYVVAGRARAENFHWKYCVDRVVKAMKEFSTV